MARDRSDSSSAAQEGKPRKRRFRWVKDIWNAYQMTRRAEPIVTLWILGAFVGVVVLVGAAVVTGLLDAANLGDVVVGATAVTAVVLFAVMLTSRRIDADEH